MAGEDPATDAPKEDKRLEWLEKWIELKMNAKPAVFKKMLASDTGAAVHHFLSNPDCRRVFVIGKDKDNKELISADLPPAALLSKRRAVYFCKLDRHPVTADNIEQVVMPEYVLACESVVSTWARQIKAALKADPEAPPPGTTMVPGMPAPVPLYEPLHELEFWGVRASNLAAIGTQLTSARVRKVLRVLELAGSSYFSAIARLELDVSRAAAEAADIVRFLEPLRTDLAALEQVTPDAFSTLKAGFAPLFHRTLLVWSHSRHYSLPARLAVLIRQMGNALVQRAREFIDHEALFNLEPPEMLERLGTALEVGAAFKAAYFEARDASVQHVPANPWKFGNSALFARLDQFIERCHDLQELATTIAHFARLDRIELGGPKGRALSASIAQMHEDFGKAAEHWKSISYDPLDIATKAFDDDFFAFRMQVKAVERKCVAVLNQGFEDCPTVSSAFKLIDAFEGLLERDAMQSDLLRKQAELTVAYAVDLKGVQRLFLHQKDKSAEGFYLEREGPPLYCNMPPVAGAIYWVRGLVDRVDAPMAKLRDGMTRVFDLDESREALGLHRALLQQLHEYEQHVYAGWAAGVEDTAGAKLRLPLLLRDASTKLLSVNFDPQLVKLLREVRYFTYLTTEKHPLEIPAAAAELHKDAETFRVLTGNLTLITSKYNQMVTTMLPVEIPLLEREMGQLDTLLEQGVSTFTWKSLQVSSFVREALNLVNTAHTKLIALKENLKAIHDIIEGWNKAPLMRRKATATYMPKDFEDQHKPYLASRYEEVVNGGKALHKLLLESHQITKLSKGSPAWKAYVDYVNELLIDGLGRLVGGSLRFVSEQLDTWPGREMTPLLEVQIELLPPDVVFTPRLRDATVTTGSDSGGSNAKPLFRMVAGWVVGFFGVCKLIKRLDRADGDFFADVTEREDVKFCVHEVQRLLFASFAVAERLVDPLLEYKHLWTANIAAELLAFLQSQSQWSVSPDTPSTAPNSPGTGVPAPIANRSASATAAMETIARMQREPPVAIFEAAVAEKKTKADEVAAMPVSSTHGWLKVDGKPLKQALSTWVAKWMFAYTQHLHANVEDCLVNLNAFMADVKGGLDKAWRDEGTPPLSDAELIALVGHIHAVSEANDAVEEIFEPLRGSVSVLRKYAIPLSDETVELLEKAPFAWEDTKKLVTAADEQLQAPKATYAKRVTEEAEAFTADVASFRSAFKEHAPFGFESGGDGAYVLLDEWQTKLGDVERRADAIRGRELLFGLRAHPWREIGTCRDELRQLKLLWDHAMLVENVFASWQTTLWANIDCDACYSAAKRLQTQVVGLEKRVRQAPAWGVYTGTRKALDQMLNTMPLLQDLRDEAMRERHWKKLMRTCGRTFVLDAKLCLKDLLQCQLHLFADAVTDIVEQSRQEIKIDKILQKIDGVWLGLQLEYQLFKSTGVKVLIEPALGPIYEALDEHETALQAMMANRFVGFFEVQVGTWKNKLAGVRATLDAWVEVQRQWCSLESIFLGSEDIREQLPEDAKRFDGIDNTFKEQMADASATLSPVDACLKEGRREALAVCEAALALCSRSLSDYLETKRRKFPRFYFISAADLVDILSKGRTPPLVQEHFSKFTDNTGGIVWERDPEGGGLSGTALGMTSGEREHVPFLGPLVCEGPVEDWLQSLMEHSKRTLREKLSECLTMSLELSRERFLEQACAQHAITTSQLWWSTDVYAAFEKLEGGNEAAIKEYVLVVVQGLETLSRMVLGELTWEMRTKIKTIITIEVHARDVVQRFVINRIDSSQAFAWQSQLKYRWDDQKHDCFINICDAEFQYSHEYVGNCGRLVITGLTDRCYITLTQALRLILGGAPAGPAGTGKTETTKDLGRGLAIWVVVMNCSDQMTARSMANTFSGLAQTGAWGCFDEFNRIPVEVLSVTAGQYGCVLNAIRAAKPTFLFDEEEINLTPTVGAFITMNPGYAGRTELPENLKALFRGCAMVVPDFEAIIEIELSAEGFIEAKTLAHKFYTLFNLSKELLSKQTHYDWGLRAIKGILRIAGGMKRGEPEKLEIQILMRALRDVNLPKFVMADFGVFLGLIADLFPRVECPKQADAKLTEGIIAHLAHGGARGAHLADGCPLMRDEHDVFISKICSLSELFSVRHCCFILGAAGSSKSEVWRTLAAVQTTLGLGGGKTNAMCLNPKACSSNELYGFVNPTTKELNDGIIAKIMRDFSKSDAPGYKWMVLDGDIDAEWIESMNTVMDDNKVLTLVSNERIPVTGSMRLLLEVSHFRNASPATASRGGVLFLNEADVGWKPLLDSWVYHKAEHRGRTADSRCADILGALCEQYVAPTLSFMRKNKLVHVTPLMDIAMVETFTRLLDGLLTPTEVPVGSERDTYEPMFQMAAVWAFGGGLAADKVADHRKTFSEWWRTEWNKTTVKWPDGGLVFDYVVEPPPEGRGPKAMVHWRSKIPAYMHLREAAFASIVVPTMETTRLTYLLDLLMPLGAPVMFVGNAGCAKTTVLGDKLRSLPDHMISYTVNFNSFSTCWALQPILEAPLEKKSGMTFGPPGMKKLVYFLDDCNMPTPDKYGTQSAIALLEQQVDYGGFYDLKKLVLKTVINIQYLGAMNPTAGSFFIQDRLQRHFSTFACLFPDAEVLATIYGSILSGHLLHFAPEVAAHANTLTNATLTLHKEIADSFLPTAVKFHYQFNLRELSAVFQGLTLSSPEYFNYPMQMARLWLHEVHRVYADRLTDEQDHERFNEIASRVARNFFESLEPPEALLAEPVIFASFAIEAEEKTYFSIDTYEKLKRLLEGRLAEYNESNARMDLVLFEQAMQHVTRITRIIDNPRGNALLVGVGGSGKQSLTRLASYISGYAVFQVKLTAAYSMGDFKADLFAQYTRAGIKGDGVVFLFSDQQIVDERMLVYFNDVLSVGMPPDLFNQEDKDNAINAIRAEVKAAGLMDSSDNCWEFFVTKVRKNLHVVLCMSPVGAAFRVRCRKFPALANCTVIDWFTPWPEEALISVAQRFLGEVDFADDDVRDNVAHHMAFVHRQVDATCGVYLAEERRNVYTTPKSYLELIALYKRLLARQNEQLEAMRDRLATGLVKLRSSAEQVAGMQVQLKEEQVVVEQKKAETEALLVQVGQEAAVADEQGAIAAIEEEKVAGVAKDVMAFQRQCEIDLASAEPAVKKAMAALGGLDKNSLTELKSLTTPPAEVLNVTAAVQYMTAKKGTNLKKIDTSWNAAKKFMGDAASFLAMLQAFDKDNFLLENKAEVRKFTGPPDAPNPNFNYDYMKSKSGAAAGLCDWIVNICIYHDIYLMVEPKRNLLKEAEVKLDDANRKLETVRNAVQVLEDRKRELQDQLMAATNEKNRLLEAAAVTAKRLNLAERLVNGLKDENERWGAGVEALKEQQSLLAGDVMISSSFIAYIGPFNEGFRARLIASWLEDVKQRSIPGTGGGVDPIAMLSDEATIANWQRQGLPADRLSVENGAILNNCSRWPLLVDPQLQGINWLRQREAPNGVVIVQLSQKGYLDKVQGAMTEGLPIIIENLGESIDAVLEPVVARTMITKGRKVIIKLGDTEVDLACAKDAGGNPTTNPLFRLFLQTKLPNPHYIPELQAQTTLINFTVTEKGLEDQLLARTVNKERPDLEEQRIELVEQQNAFTIKLKELEDDLLLRLANAEGDILADEELIISLEDTKATVGEINEKKKIAAETTIKVNAAREAYRAVATRGSLIYFLIDRLRVVDHMYQYSLAAFAYVFSKALDKATPAETLAQRGEELLSSVTFNAFCYVTRGLFERHRLIFSLQLACRILINAKQLDPELVNTLVRGPKVLAENVCASWLGDDAWQRVVALGQLEQYAKLPKDVEASAKRWKEWCDAPQPEHEPLPGDFKRLTGIEKLLVVRALRGDRTTLAVALWVKDVLGARYGEAVPFDLPASFEDAGPAVPIFFLLSAGVAVPMDELGKLGKLHGMTEEAGTFVMVSLGQGQEPVAEKALDRMYANGGWVLLQNIELVANWLPKLEKKLEALAVGANPSFRVFLSALPQKVVPVAVLQSSIKLTNEPPSGLKANMLRAYGSFTEAIWESTVKPNELKSIIFALCFFHSCVCERRKFGPIGWNRAYPFNPGDLSVCITVANNYLDASPKVPWDDLRYIFGEIMYGGHITDNWDRRLCSNYLIASVNEQLLENLNLFPKFEVPPSHYSHKQYCEYIEERLATETPAAYGLHANSEINFMTRQADELFAAVAELQPRATGGGGGGISMQERATECH